MALDNTEQIMANVGAKATGISQGVYDFLFIFFCVAALAGLAWFIFWWRSFRYKVKIKEVLSGDGNFIVCEDFAKRKSLGNAEFWKLRGRKALSPAPPREASGSAQAEGREKTSSGRTPERIADAIFAWYRLELKSSPD